MAERACWLVAVVSLFALWRMAAADALTANAWADALVAEVETVFAEMEPK